MIKGARARERVYTITMWVVSVVFAGFLIGLGGLVIGDLPRAANDVSVDQFVDQQAWTRNGAERTALDREAQSIRTRLETAEQDYQRRVNDTQAAQVSFDNWIATRTATTDPAQDPQVLIRTRALDVFKIAERAAQEARDLVAAELTEQERRLSANSAARADLENAAYPAYERARFGQELQVFGLRLAFTLPLLALAAFFLLQKNKGDYWPLKRGFVLFAAFAFFVELVPYLPDYGGYVRYGVGILVTILASHFIIKWMRAYLKSREAAEAKAEVERKKAIQYDEALKKMSAKTCPGCDRVLAASEDAKADFCMHCGMQLFNHCPACDTRKFAFFRYCMKCGAPATEAPSA